MKKCRPVRRINMNLPINFKFQCYKPNYSKYECNKHYFSTFNRK